MYEYEKTLLYIYPRIGILKALYFELADNKIMFSIDENRDPVKLAGEIIDCIYLRDTFDKVKGYIEKVMESLSEEELCMLEYKFFRRRRMVKHYQGKQFECSYASFLRKIRETTGKFALGIRNIGYSEEDFKRDFSGCDIVMKIYAGVRAKKDSYAYSKRQYEFSFAAKCPEEGVSRDPHSNIVSSSASV